MCHIGSDAKVHGGDEKPADASVNGNLDQSFVTCNVRHLIVKKHYWVLFLWS